MLFSLATHFLHRHCLCKNKVWCSFASVAGIFQQFFRSIEYSA